MKKYGVLSWVLRPQFYVVTLNIEIRRSSWDLTNNLPSKKAFMEAFWHSKSQGNKPLVPFIYTNSKASKRRLMHVHARPKEKIVTPYDFMLTLQTIK